MYICTHIHTYIHIYIYTYIHICSLWVCTWHVPFVKGTEVKTKTTNALCGCFVTNARCGCFVTGTTAAD